MGELVRSEVRMYEFASDADPTLRQMHNRQILGRLVQTHSSVRSTTTGGSSITNGQPACTIFITTWHFANLAKFKVVDDQLLICVSFMISYDVS